MPKVPALRSFVRVVRRSAPPLAALAAILALETTGSNAQAPGPQNFSNVPIGCNGITVVYTNDPDFNLGSLNGVVTNGNQLELDPGGTTWEHAWIANAAEGTVSKVSTITGKEVARYFTGPPDINGHGYNSPSRTVVDRDGNCWVANRTMSGTVLPSVTQIVTTGGEDRNSNSIIETSTDMNLNGIIEPFEMLPWGQDERVVRHYPIGTTFNNGARGFAIDKMGFLWVGLTADQRLVKIDPALSTAIYAPNLAPPAVPELVSVYVGYMPYGLALSPNGKLYMCTRNQEALEIDPGLASGGTAAGPAVTQTKIHTGSVNYCIAVDQDCIVWLSLVNGASGTNGCLRWDPTVGVGNPSLGWVQSLSGTPGPGRGITVDFSGKIWMACNDAANSIVKFDNTNPPVVLGVYPTPVLVPVGIGVAEDGNIIVTPGAGSGWRKRNSLTGGPMPLVGPQLVGSGPYTYSDFTGNLQNISSVQQGTWNVITDGLSNSIIWNLVSWTPSTPPGTSVQVEARVASNLGILSTQPWTTIFPPGPLGSPMPGRYIETRVRLQRAAECGVPFVTPILYDLTVAGICDTCEFVSCPDDTTVICQNPDGAEVFYATPVLNAGCDSTYVVTCSPPPGFFPIGITPVQCTAVNASGDTIICTFTVSVSGDCDPPATGACCIGGNCIITTEIGCEQEGGIYLGDNTNCQDGCGDDCVEPPNGLIGWWPFDGATSGITPNLAGPTTGGALVGPPTPVTGQYVTNAYDFNGVSHQVVVPHSSTLNIGGSDFSADFWIRTRHINGVATVLDKRSANPIQGFAVFLFNGYPGIQLAVAGGFSNYILSSGNGGPAAFVGDDAWHFVAVTVDRNDPSGIQFYVDGAPVGTPLDPTGRQGNLNCADDLWIARSYPILSSSVWLDGSLDEIEIFRREISAADVANIYAANDAGKCREACYATQQVPCCHGFGTSSSFTLCNYDVVSHVYSFGVTALSGGPGCSLTGPSAFSPTSGTVTVPAGTCLTIPILITCPSGIPVGQVSCYQVNVFNHDTGRTFHCQGSVRKPAWWCIKWTKSDLSPVESVFGISPGFPEALAIHVGHVAVGGGGMSFPYEIRAVFGHDLESSEAVSLNGLPPGEPVIGSLSLDEGEEEAIPIEVGYADAANIGFDRIVIFGDDDMDGTLEPIGELGVRAVTSGTSDVPWEPPVVDGEAVSRPFLSLPNPFSNSGRIRFRVEGSAPVAVSLQAFDLQGRPVKTFLDAAVMEPGEHGFEWDGRSDGGGRLSSGIYFLKLTIGGAVETVKIAISR